MKNAEIDSGCKPGLTADMAAKLKTLERENRELQGAAIDYVPSQYLCELIKKAGYDGVLYKSSIGDGNNLALFDPSQARGGRVEQHKAKADGV